jgi:zinc-ribbon domain
VAMDAKHSGQQTPGRLHWRPNLTDLHRRARTALADALEPGEEPRLVIRGLGATAMIATDRRVFVFKAGARAGLPFSSRLKSFEYESVMRVDVRRAGDMDVVVIHAPQKISSCSSYWVDGRDDPWRARNAVPVGRASAETDRAVAEVSARVAAIRDRARRTLEKRSASERITGIDKGGPRVGLTPIRGEAESAPPAGAAFEDCPRCGKRLRVGWQFCPRCGAPAKLGPGRRTARRRRRSQSS